MSENQQWALRVERVVRAVRESTGEVRNDLPYEFGPAHLSVALIDAVFNPQLTYYDRVVPIVERYCRYFGLSRLWKSGDGVPPPETQETLTDLIGHYEKLEMCGMREEVFRANYCSPGTRVPKSDNVLYCAKALRCICIERIQDVREQRMTKVKDALCSVHGIGERTAHMLLMYCGREEVVKGDVHIRGFVSQALGGTKVEAEEAERLVADAAKAMGVSPRVLDAHIWESRAQGGARERETGYCRHASHGRRRKRTCESHDVEDGGTSRRR